MLLTNEYPPNIYGGAGIHVDYLSRELAKLCSVDVRCFGNQKIRQDALSVTGYDLKNTSYTAPLPLPAIMGAIQRNLDFNTTNIDADIVHCHTWYTHLGGIIAKLNYSIPLVVTTHSLEPLRPWKREQLAGGYDFSCWVERTALQMADAIIAVSDDTKKDVLNHFDVSPEKIHIIHNGIDLNEYHKTENKDLVQTFGIDLSKPYILFVGRITRQKGIIHLVNAIKHMHDGFQIVLCAGAPDTPAIAEEMASEINSLQQTRPGIIWIREMVSTPAKIALYSHAALFCCPSIYEPFGIINLEAMACETPVVASAVGGIKEVVLENETGFLITTRQDTKGAFLSGAREQFEHDLAEKINILMQNADLRRKMGQAGRRRAEEMFSWSSIAARTRELYESLIN